jgi:hypothetical protein
VNADQWALCIELHELGAKLMRDITEGMATSEDVGLAAVHMTNTEAYDIDQAERWEAKRVAKMLDNLAQPY